MKKFWILLIIILGLTACKTSKGHCDAYGQKEADLKTINA